MLACKNAAILIEKESKNENTNRTISLIIISM